MNRRKMLMLQQQILLPAGYTQVKYLESRPGSYMEVPYKPKTNTVYYLRCATTTISTEAGINGSGFFGARNADYVTGSMLHRNENKFAGRFGQSEWQMYDSEIIPYEIYDVIFSYRRLNVNGVEIAMGGTIIADCNSNFNLYLFARNWKNIVETAYGYNRIYELKINEKNNEDEKCIHHILPCLDNNDVPCMYDVITKKTFYDKSTSGFDYELM